MSDFAEDVGPERRKVEIVTANGEHATGYVTLQSKDRISDEMNDPHLIFINLIDVTITKEGFTKQFKHVGFNKASIQAFYEVD